MKSKSVGSSREVLLEYYAIGRNHHNWKKISSNHYKAPGV